MHVQKKGKKKKDINYSLLSPPLATFFQLWAQGERRLLSIGCTFFSMLNVILEDVAFLCGFVLWGHWFCCPGKG
jgi:hypothetical protein